MTRDIRPLFLLLASEKSHAAVRLLVCKQTRDGSLLLPTFFGSSGRVSCMNFRQFYVRPSTDRTAFAYVSYRGRRRSTAPTRRNFQIAYKYFTMTYIVGAVLPRRPRECTYNDYMTHADRQTPHGLKLQKPNYYIC